MIKLTAKDIIVLDLETQKSFDEVGGRYNLAKLKISLGFMRVCSNFLFLISKKSLILTTRHLF